jgi:hypothetical protein
MSRREPAAAGNPPGYRLERTNNVDLLNMQAICVLLLAVVVAGECLGASLLGGNSAINSSFSRCMVIA